MNIPTLDERRTYWKWAYATKCFLSVRSAIQHIQKNSITDEHYEYIIIAGVVATYAKPFTKCHGVGVLDKRIIPDKYIRYHSNIIDMRHKSVAHLDALNYMPDDSSLGNINRVVVFKTKKGEYGFRILTETIETLNHFKINELCSILIDKAKYHTERFEQKYLCISSVPNGDYLLNIDPTDSRAFISNPKNLTNLDVARHP